VSKQCYRLACASEALAISEMEYILSLPATFFVALRHTRFGWCMARHTDITKLTVVSFVNKLYKLFFSISD
jgi:hypothetical protein